MMSPWYANVTEEDLEIFDYGYSIRQRFDCQRTDSLSCAGKRNEPSASIRHALLFNAFQKAPRHRNRALLSKSALLLRTFGA